MNETNEATRVRVYTVPEVADAAAHQAAKMFGGYTLFDTIGGWVSNNVQVDEGGKVLEIITEAGRAKIASFLVLVDRFAQAADQEAVLVTQDTVEMTIRYTS